jgi:hypothetical protein
MAYTLLKYTLSTMNHRIAHFLIIIFQIAIFPAYGDGVRLWKPSELLERSEIVIIGQPFDIKATGETGSIQMGGGSIFPTVFYTAKVRVDEVIKGDDFRMVVHNLFVKNEAKVISVTYSIIDESKIIDHHYVHRVTLQDDRMFLLYLKASKGGVYVSSLDGEINDYQTAVPLRKLPAEQGGTGQPATRPQSKPEGDDKPQPEAEGRSR